MLGETVLDRYVVEEELGRGAMGTVYRGRHTKLKRPVAIKVMHDHLTGEPTLMERFRREARVAGKLDHANVVSVLDIGETNDGRPVMVMEYAAGRSLKDVMVGPLPVKRMLALLVQLLRGLDHAHSMGLVHRDLKPDNVILQGDLGDEVVRIVDFGIAVLRGREEVDGGKLTGTGMIVGTPQYMAPEQAKCEPIDQRADLYALGVIMYEMIGGRTPFDGTAMEVAVMKIDTDPPPISSRVPGVTVDRVLDAFMRRLLARAPVARFSTAHEALQVLELYQEDRLAAAAELGVIDVEQALAVISLPEPPR
ncbi:MAG TPA: serine/threonine-protein kinase [Kofleriaceae bacterium]|nr:serine/threonine-protein kinase [Kofleriaceae bacterium]